MVKEIVCDIVVIGAGSSGIAAAISADRSGARVLLIEKSGMLGGQATQAQVGTICGLYARETLETSKVGRFANHAREILQSKFNLALKVAPGGLGYLPYDFTNFEELAYELLDHSKVELYLHASVFDLAIESGRILTLDVFSGVDRFKIHAEAYVDATGEGLISKISNLPLIEDQEYQASGYVARISNLAIIEELTEQDLNLIILKEVTEAEKANRLRNISSRFSVVPGSLKNNSVSLKFAYPYCRTAKFNELTAAEEFGRKTIFDTYRWIKNNIKIFHHSEISMLASQVGVRSGPRNHGKTVLTGKDVLSCRKNDLAVANGFWPIELWNEDRKPTVNYFYSGDFYQIPASCLRSLHLENLFMCGRGLSADMEAVSSARVIGTCFGTGVAAGALAAGLVNKEEENEIVKKIQKTEEL